MPADEGTTFGALLRRCRIDAGLTQEFLAERAGLSTRAISDLERGVRTRPRLYTVQQLAIALQIPDIQFTAFKRAARPRPQPVAPSPGAAVHSSALPTQLTSFIGRERELSAVLALLQQPEVRLLTLTGTGGTGKTRLAVQAANSLLPAFSGEIFFVPLARVTDLGLVLPTIAAAVGLSDTSEGPLLERLIERVLPRPTLLLLDNAEHLPTVGAAASDLLDSCPLLHILATSREPLHVYGEQQFPVPPLAVPEADGAADPTTALKCEAIRLFVDRARAVHPKFVLTEEIVGSVVAICRQLDGLPLAIELAAARSNILTPDALLERLAGSLALLSGGAHNMPERQRTMRGALAWSYDLLTTEEQRLFRCLAQFAGGCSIAALEAVCPPADQVLDLVSSLVNKSLVRTREGPDGDSRFAMLEIVRTFGKECLGESGERDQIQRAHALYYHQLAAQAAGEFRGSNQGRWLAQLEAERDNLRLALRWALHNEDQDRALLMAAHLELFWAWHGHLSEGRRWLDDLLAHWPERVTTARAMAASAGGMLASVQGEHERAQSLYEDSLRLYRTLGDNAGIAEVLSRLANTALDRGQVIRGVELAEESVTRYRGLDQPMALSVALRTFASALLYRGDFERANRMYEECLVLSYDLGGTSGIAAALVNLTGMALYYGDTGKAVGYGEEALALFRELGHKTGAEAALLILALASLADGDLSRSVTLVSECLALSRELGDTVGIIDCVEEMACALEVAGQSSLAACIWGASSAARETYDAPLSEFDRLLYEPYRRATTRHLGDPAFAAALAGGRGVALDRAIEDAVRVLQLTPVSD